MFTSYQQQAEDTANLVNTVMLDSGMQSYRRVVSDVVQYEQAAMSAAQADAAQNILNTETGKVLTGVSTRQEALRRARAAEITAAIEGLREPYRPVCRLCLLEEKSPEEAALALGRPVKTIHTQLSRGKRLLREQLERSEAHGTLPH